MDDDLRQLGNPGTPAFQLNKYPFFLLNRAVSRYNAIIEKRLRGIGIDIPTWRVLMILGEAAPRSVSQIAEAAVINTSTMTRIIQRMMRANLVVCAPRPDDNRVIEVYLTELGSSVLADARRTTAPIYDKLVDGFSESEFGALISLLDHLYRNLARADIA